jgi:hypothetical protein
VGVQEVRWDKGGKVTAGYYGFFCGERKYKIEKNEMGGACSVDGVGERRV